MKITTFTLRTLLLSSCLTVMVSCKEEPSKTTEYQNKNQIQEQSKDQIEPKEIDQTKGVTYFEEGIQALEANNMPLAFKEFLYAAEEGHIDSQYNVGLMYEQGIGVDKDINEAFLWYAKSADQGNAAAQFNIGVCYENGFGTAVDFNKANEFYRKASVQGDGLAVGNLGMLYIRAQGVKENLVAGVALLILSTTMDMSPENQAKNNISATRGLTPEMIAEAQTLSTTMSTADNLLVPLDQYLKVSEL